MDAEEARLRGIFAGPLGPFAAEVLAQGVAARKAFALAVQANYRADAKCLFALLDGREIRPLLFRALELGVALAPARVEE